MNSGDKYLDMHRRREGKQTFNVKLRGGALLRRPA